MSNYLRVLLTFARNSLVRDMTFRANFLIDSESNLRQSIEGMAGMPGMGSQGQEPANDEHRH